MTLVIVQLKTELRQLLRNGEQLLLILGIPVFLLVFFGTVDVLPMGSGDPLSFLVPGVLAVSVMSTIPTTVSPRSKVAESETGTPPFSTGALAVSASIGRVTALTRARASGRLLVTM